MKRKNSKVRSKKRNQQKKRVVVNVYTTDRHNEIHASEHEFKRLGHIDIGYG